MWECTGTAFGTEDQCAQIPDCIPGSSGGSGASEPAVESDGAGGEEGKTRAVGKAGGAGEHESQSLVQDAFDTAEGEATSWAAKCLHGGSKGGFCEATKAISDTNADKSDGQGFDQVPAGTAISSPPVAAWTSSVAKEVAAAAELEEEGQDLAEDSEQEIYIDSDFMTKAAANTESDDDSDEVSHKTEAAAKTETDDGSEVSHKTKASANTESNDEVSHKDENAEVDDDDDEAESSSESSDDDDDEAESRSDSGDSLGEPLVNQVAKRTEWYDISDDEVSHKTKEAADSDSDSDSTTNKIEGTIKKYSANKGFGFVSPNDGGDDCYVHLKENPDIVHCVGGEQVIFDKKWDDSKGKYKGVNCTILGEETVAVPGAAGTCCHDRLMSEPCYSCWRRPASHKAKAKDKTKTAANTNSDGDEVSHKTKTAANTNSDGEEVSHKKGKGKGKVLGRPPDAGKGKGKGKHKQEKGKGKKKKQSGGMSSEDKGKAHTADQEVLQNSKFAFVGQVADPAECRYWRT